MPPIFSSSDFVRLIMSYNLESVKLGIPFFLGAEIDFRVLQTTPGEVTFLQEEVA